MQPVYNLCTLPFICLDHFHNFYGEKPKIVIKVCGNLIPGTQLSSDNQQLVEVGHIFVGENLMYSFSKFIPLICTPVGANLIGTLPGWGGWCGLNQMICPGM